MHIFRLFFTNQINNIALIEIIQCTTNIGEAEYLEEELMGS